MRLLAALALAVVLGTGCGSDDDTSSAPVRVNSALVPPTLGDGTLDLSEDEKAHEAFGKIQGTVLVEDGRLWAVRDGERLVATLQVSTLDSRVDLGDADELDSLISSLLPGTKERFTVGDLSVVQVATDDKTVYLWFGERMFQVLQIKGTELNHEALLTELITYQTGLPAWQSPPTTEAA